MIYFVTGEVNSGKTSHLSIWVDEYHKQNCRICGILAPSVSLQDGKLGYNLIDVFTGEAKQWASLLPINNAEKWGRFWFSWEGLHFGQNALNRIDDSCDIGILDEIGPFELENRGWASSLREILTRSPKNMIIVVRTSLVKPVSVYFGIESYQVLTRDSPAPSIE